MDLYILNICFLKRKKRMMYGTIIRNKIPEFNPFPIVKSSLLLFIICALHVEQPCEKNSNLIISKENINTVL